MQFQYYYLYFIIVLVLLFFLNLPDRGRYDPSGDIIVISEYYCLEGQASLLSRWRKSAKESDKIESLDGHWQALKEKRRFPPVSSDGRHSAANLVDEIARWGVKWAQSL